MDRRRFVRSLGAAALAAQLPAPRLTAATAAPAAVRPKRLAAGDTVALVSPASATFNSSKTSARTSTAWTG